MTNQNQSRRSLVSRLLYPAAAAVALSTNGRSMVAQTPDAVPLDRHDNDERDEHGFTTLTVDFTQDPDPNKQANIDPNEGQLTFSKGDFFSTLGTIYKEGTIPRGHPGNDPKATAGKIGTYQIRGTFTIDAADFTRAVGGDRSAPSILAFATEVFLLPDEENTILTDGLWPNAFFNARRPVLGGTGRFAGIIGEAIAHNIGENSGGYCNFRVTFRLRKP